MNSRKTREDLKRLGYVESVRIVRFITERLPALDDPRTIGELLVGPQFADLWRYWVGPARTLADIDHGNLRVLIVEIDHRAKIYKV